MDKLAELLRRRPNRWGNLTIKEFERDIKLLQDTCEHLVIRDEYVKRLEKQYDELITKLADIRELFDESDEKAECHGMEDMIADPYAVAVYTENKMKRLIEKNKCYKEALHKIATRKMSQYLNTSNMNQDFIKIANEALRED